VHDVDGVGVTVVGEEAHVVAREAQGPRGNDELPLDLRDEYENLILLCSKHHKIIDDHPGTYTVPLLRDMKARHLAWAASIETPEDEALRRDSERYASYVDEWTRCAQLDQWDGALGRLCSHGHPSLRRDTYDSLAELRGWLLSRVWPRRYPVLEDAFENFRKVLNDLIAVFASDLEDREDGDVLWIRKTYQGLPWNPELYEQRLNEFNDHVDLIEDLTLELTRAANLLCDRTREFIDPSYRIEEGIVLISAGPMLNFNWETYRVEYAPDQREGTPYPGVAEFAEAVRFTRDVYFGSRPPDASSARVN